MKKLLFLTVLLACSTTLLYSAKKPNWVMKRPVDKENYIGIGYALTTDPNYLQEAKRQALNDLISEISVGIQSETLLNMVATDDDISTRLSQSIKMSAQEDLEQFQLTDSWGDKKEYWVLYRLNKAEWQRIKAARIKKATDAGYDFWTQGISAQRNGDLTAAANMYVKGLEAIQPVANEALPHSHNGQTVDVGIALFTSLKQLFSNINVTADPGNLQMRPMQQAEEPVVISVTQNGNPLKNVKLKIDFLTGSGKLSSNNVTNSAGVIDLYVQSITSKLSRQEILATIDAQQFSSIKNPFFESVFRSFQNNLPRTVITINVEESTQKAYIHSEGSNNDALVRAVSSLLTNNHFTVVTDPEQANLLIQINSSMKKGGLIKGDMFDFNEYFTNVNIKVSDADSRVLISYSVNNHRSLSPASASETAAWNAAVKDVMQRINKEFKKELEKVNINN